MSIEMIVAVLAVIALGTFVRSAFGFGDGLVAMPLLAFMIPLRLAAPVVALCSTAMAVFILAGAWREISLRDAWRLLLGSCFGLPIGLFFLKGAAEGALMIALALVIISFSSYRLARPQLMELRNERTAMVFGFVAGILGGAYNCNGPPIVIYGTLRRWTPRAFRATMQGFFLPAAVMIAAGHGLAGLWTREALMLFAASLPVMGLAIWVGAWTHRRIPAARFDHLIHVLLIALGVLLLIRALFPGQGA